VIQPRTRGPRVLRIAIVVALLALAGAALSVAFWQPREVNAAASATRSHHASGVIHVHTTHSDGRGTPEDVVAAAQNAGLAFVVITDHNGFEARHLEGYSGSVLTMVGTEISTRSGHVVALGLQEPTYRFTDDALDVMQDIRDLGGVEVVAHPDHPRDDFRWTPWDLGGPWGIEILNSDSQWRQAGWFQTAAALFAYPINPTYALLKVMTPPVALVAQWDRLLESRNVFGVAGADAHGFPSYESVFKLARNHVVLEKPLTRNAADDTQAITSSLRRGRSYIAVDALAPADQFFFIAEQGGQQWTMGDDVPATPAPRLVAGGAMPDGARLTLRRHGEVIAEGLGTIELAAAQPGVYRVEAFVPGWDVPWIVSNPIYVFDEPTHDVRRARQDFVQPPDELPKRILDDFEDGTSFESSSDTSTVAASQVQDPAADTRGSRSFRLTFTLGVTSDSAPSPFAAAARQRAEDLSGAQGMSFWIKGDAQHRVWIQVRDVNRSSPDGTEWWYASVKATPEWRRVTMPFARFRTRDERSDGRLNAEQVTGIYFIVDAGVAKPGTQGTLWLDDVGVY
jgi:hypothetical protein